MKDKLPIIVVVAVAGLVIAAGLWVRFAMRPSAAPPPEPEAHAARSERVEDRLADLRDDWEERHREAAGAPQKPGQAARPQAAAPMNRGTRESWKVARPAKPPVARGPVPRPARPGKGPWPHPAYMDANLSVDQLEDVLLTNPDSTRRVEALLQLSGEEDADAVRVLSRALANHDPDPEVRALVVESLGDYPDSINAGMLQTALQDEDANVRFEAVSVLGMLDDPAATNMVRKLVNDPDEDVRDLAQGVVEFRK